MLITCGRTGRVTAGQLRTTSCCRGARLDETRRAIGEWARLAVPKAVAYARALLPPAVRHQAEDVVQDVLCRLLTPGRYDLPADGDRLLFRSITNACINATVRRRELASLDARHADGDLPPGPRVIGDEADEPEQRAISAELAERVARAIDALPALQRAVVSLRAMGVPPDQIAATLDLSGNYVAVLTHRARHALAELLADVLGEES